MAPKRSTSTEGAPPTKRAKAVRSSEAVRENESQLDGKNIGSTEQIAEPRRSEPWQQRVQDLAQRNLRYLFRAWYAQSGGQKGLNTMNAIIIGILREKRIRLNLRHPITHARKNRDQQPQLCPRNSTGLLVVVTVTCFRSRVRQILASRRHAYQRHRYKSTQRNEFCAFHNRDACDRR